MIAKYSVILLFVFSLFSCGEEENQEVYKPTSMGTQGQLLVVMHDKMWEGKLGGLVKDYVAPEIKYYPQIEYLFDIKHNNKATFNKSTKRHKNILQFEINDHPEIESSINYLTDVWAKDQVVVRVTGKSQQDIAQLFVDNAQDIQDYLTDKEIGRLKVQIEQKKNHLIEKELEDKHHLSVTVPIDMELLINNESFVALERKRLRSEGGSAGDIQQYLVIYHYPYTSDKIWNKEHLISVRDSVVKKYFRSNVNDSAYMRTTPDSLAPVFERERLFKNNYAFEMRGQYSMVNDFRGGPFISISLVDEKRNRVVTLEGQVFAPKFNKREFMMELETMINSLSLY